MRLLLTGASGFVGSALLRRCVADGASIRACYRRLPAVPPDNVECIAIPDLESAQGWRVALTGVDVLIHTAARVHVMREAAIDPLSEFRRVNVDGTLALAQWAAEAGVRRFIFLSSVKVSGEQTAPGLPFHEDEVAAPEDAYGCSKYEAELGLRRIADDTGMAVVIVRPPLVYGPGVRANFRSLLRAVLRGVPLPFGAIKNKRSLVGLGNLVDFLSLCVHHPNAVNQTFFVSDGQDVSTLELIRAIAASANGTSRIFFVPVSWLLWIARLMGRESTIQRLCGNLQIDISKARNLLEWSPRFTLEEELKLVMEKQVQYV